MSGDVVVAGGEREVIRVGPEIPTAGRGRGEVEDGYALASSYLGVKRSRGHLIGRLGL